MDPDETLIAIELDALRASCDEVDLEIDLDAQNIRVMVTAREAEDMRFVEAQLCFHLPPGYPEDGSLPDVQIIPAKTRGLGDLREGHLVKLLGDEAQSLSGELMLGHLIEVGCCEQGYMGTLGPHCSNTQC